MICLLLVSVNYSDYLKITLSHNHLYFNKIIIVTVESDTECQQLCSKYHNVVCVVVDDCVLKTNNRVFNKGAVLNKGFEHLDKMGWGGWTVITDADIIFPKNIRELILTRLPVQRKLFSLYRRHLFTYESYVKYFDSLDSIHLDWFKNQKPGEQTSTCLWPIAIGYCQIFRYMCGRYRYGEFNDAEDSDIDFIRYFSDQRRWHHDDPGVQLLSDDPEKDFVIHLGESKVNWKGRISTEFC